MPRNKPQVTRPQNIEEIHPSDLCETPSYGVKPLLNYIWPEFKIWEPAVGSGKIKNFLEEKGFEVEGSDLQFGQNFFEFEPTRWDIIITNPPYSIKYQWLERCYELGKPFALLVPIETIGAAKAQKLLKQKGFEIMLLDSRVDFYMPNKGLSGNGAQFPVMWLTYNILDKTIVFANISKDKAEFKKSLKEIL